MSNAYSRDALNREVECELRGLGIPPEYHHSEDPSDAELGIVGVASAPRVHWFDQVDWGGLAQAIRSWIPGEWWHWAVFANLCLAFWLGWYLRGIIG